MSIMIRKPAVSGTFYPNDKDELIETIEDCFLSSFGVGEIPSNVEHFEGKDYPINVMVPHAGFVYSGSIASYGYFEIAKYGIPDVFIILAPNHTGFGCDISIFNEGAWNTPLGDVSVDSEFANMLIDYNDNISADFKAHAYEHAIEVQLPFLQFLSDDFKIVPITVKSQSIPDMTDIAQNIVDVADKLDKSFCIIASTDLSHFNTQERANKVDNFVLEDIEQMDSLKLMEEIIQYNITMCGYGPVIATMIASGLTGKDNAHVLAYKTSGDVSGDYSNVVGYASAIFK